MLGTVVFLGGRVGLAILADQDAGRQSGADEGAENRADDDAEDSTGSRASGRTRNGFRAGEPGKRSVTTSRRRAGDGRRQPHGVTPVTVGDLSPGNHEVTLESSAENSPPDGPGMRCQPDRAGRGNRSSGWLAVYAPFEIVISETNRASAA